MYESNLNDDYDDDDDDHFAICFLFSLQLEIQNTLEETLTAFRVASELYATIAKRQLN